MANNDVNLNRSSFVTFIASLLGGVDFESWVNIWYDQLVWAVNSIGCLGFLHGRSGTYECQPKIPAGIRRPWIRWAAKKGLKVPYSEVNIEWGSGTISWEENGRIKKMKLGKWLRKASVSEEIIKKFETRQMDTWEWKISASLWDILTMSHNRPWTSCMRPGGTYEAGLMSDMRAGAAVLFWYRPGASQPCGREILRPVVDTNSDDERYKPYIYRGGMVYGTGPQQVSNEWIEKITDLKQYPGWIEYAEGSIHNSIYDDNVQQGLKQSYKSMKIGEEKLLEGFYPYLQAGAKTYKTYNVAKPKSFRKKGSSTQPCQRKRRILSSRISVLDNMLHHDSIYYGYYKLPAGPRREYIEGEISRLQRKLEAMGPPQPVLTREVETNRFEGMTYGQYLEATGQLQEVLELDVTEADRMLLDEPYVPMEEDLAHWIPSNVDEDDDVEVNEEDRWFDSEVDTW